MKFYANGKINEYLSVAGNPFYPAYVLTGSKKNLMVDAGINLFGPLYLKSINEILGSADRLDTLLATHSHYDHIGAISYLKRKIPALKIGAHENIAELLKKDSVRQYMKMLSDVQRGMFKDIVGDEDVEITPFDLDYKLKEGDTFDLGNMTVQVHSAAGHTRDSLAFFVPETGMLFPGESAGLPEGEKAEGVQVEFLSSYDDYISAIKKMISLKPKMICHAHAWILTDDDATSFLESSLNATYHYRNLIESYLEEASGDVDRAIEIMAKREYDDRGAILQEKNAYMANLTAQVKLISFLKQRQA